MKWHQAAGRRDFIVQSARTTDDTDDTHLEPAVLSYTQFRNHLGLLEWKRRRAQYEQSMKAVQTPRPNWRQRALHAVDRL